MSSLLRNRFNDQLTLPVGLKLLKLLTVEHLSNEPWRLVTNTTPHTTIQHHTTTNTNTTRHHSPPTPHYTAHHRPPPTPHYTTHHHHQHHTTPPTTQHQHHAMLLAPTNDGLFRSHMTSLAPLHSLRLYCSHVSIYSICSGEGRPRRISN